ncbi:MAG TPA: hypothetical protein DCM10_15530 [Xanthomarina gelatinilytica]|jgi:hypothetical protein|nr:hypothetical protein [Xanthomarina gelatinilytica]|tara:strand:- start:168 stop:392 length:225 start_codon:yes stop_codon:yes gene_type:complete
MNFEFENRWYSKHEILKKFNIAEKTWKNWLYDSKTGKKKNLKSMGIYKIPGTKYWVINPYEFQEWFNNYIGAAC